MTPLICISLSNSWHNTEFTDAQPYLHTGHLAKYLILSPYS